MKGFPEKPLTMLQYWLSPLTSIRDVHVFMCVPGSIPGLGINMWVEFVIGSRLCSEVLLRVLQFSPLIKKNNISKFQFDLKSIPKL